MQWVIIADQCSQEVYDNTPANYKACCVDHLTEFSIVNIKYIFEEI